MNCPVCLTYEFDQVEPEHSCRLCKKGINPWSYQLALAAFDGTLTSEGALISRKSVAGWRAIIQAQIPSPGANIAVLTDGFALKMLERVYNNPPTPVTSLFAIPTEDGTWRIERPLTERFLPNSIE